MEYWSVAGGERSITIVARGHDREGTAPRAVALFEKLVSELPHVTIIADLREMTGYETAARVVWQEAFRRHRARIQSLVLVGARSALIRMGAAAVGAFAGIPVRFVKDFAELEARPMRDR